MAKQHQAEVEKLLKNVADVLRENHTGVIQLLQQHLTIAEQTRTILTDMQRQQAPTPTPVAGPSTPLIIEDQELKKKESILQMISLTSIRGHAWTTHFEKANEALNWDHESKCLTLAVQLKDATGQQEMLEWLLVFFTGMRHPEVERFTERPVVALIESDTAFQKIWRDILLKTKLTEYVVQAIKDRMVEYATEKYMKQRNKKKAEDGGEMDGKEKHCVIPEFKQEYADIFMVWTAQLLRDYDDRVTYVQNLKRLNEEDN